MKAIPLIIVWVTAFLVMLATCVSLNGLFWLSFLVFGAASVCMSRNRERLERELDDMFK